MHNNLIHIVLVGVVCVCAGERYSDKECEENLKASWQEQTKLESKIWLNRCQDNRLTPDGRVYLGLAHALLGHAEEAETIINQAMATQKVSAGASTQVDGWVEESELSNCESSMEHWESVRYSQYLRRFENQQYNLTYPNSCSKASNRSAIASCDETLQNNYATLQDQLELHEQNVDTFLEKLSGDYLSLNSFCQSKVENPVQKQQWASLAKELQAQKKTVNKDYARLKSSLSSQDDDIVAQEQRAETQRRESQERSRVNTLLVVEGSLAALQGVAEARGYKPTTPVHYENKEFASAITQATKTGYQGYQCAQSGNGCSENRKTSAQKYSADDSAEDGVYDYSIKCPNGGVHTIKADRNKCEQQYKDYGYAASCNIVENMYKTCSSLYRCLGVSSEIVERECGSMKVE